MRGGKLIFFHREKTLLSISLLYLLIPAMDRSRRPINLPAAIGNKARPDWRPFSKEN